MRMAFRGYRVKNGTDPKEYVSHSSVQNSSNGMRDIVDNWQTPTNGMEVFFDNPAELTGEQ